MPHPLLKAHWNTLFAASISGPSIRSTWSGGVLSLLNLLSLKGSEDNTSSIVSKSMRMQTSIFHQSQMKNRKVKFGVAMVAFLTIGYGTPVVAVLWQQHKASG